MQPSVARDLLMREIEGRPAIVTLTTIPGIGPVFSAGIGAEVGDTTVTCKASSGTRSANGNALATCATPRMPSPRSRDSGGLVPPPATLKPKTGIWPRPATATCATTSSRLLTACDARSQSTPPSTPASIGRRPNITTSGLWSRPPARALASSSVCYTATSPIAQEVQPYPEPQLHRLC